MDCYNQGCEFIALKKKKTKKKIPNMPLNMCE